jgi:hypothetical protein
MANNFNKLRVWQGERLKATLAAITHCDGDQEIVVWIYSKEAAKMESLNSTFSGDALQANCKKVGFFAKLTGARDETIQELCDRVIEEARRLDVYLDRRRSEVEEIDHQETEDKEDEQAG